MSVGKKCTVCAVCSVHGEKCAVGIHFKIQINPVPVISRTELKKSLHGTVFIHRTVILCKGSFWIGFLTGHFKKKAFFRKETDASPCRRDAFCSPQQAADGERFANMQLFRLVYDSHFHIFNVSNQLKKYKLGYGEIGKCAKKSKDCAIYLGYFISYTEGNMKIGIEQEERLWRRQRAGLHYRVNLIF